MDAKFSTMTKTETVPVQHPFRYISFKILPYKKGSPQDLFRRKLLLRCMLCLLYASLWSCVAKSLLRNAVARLKKIITNVEFLVNETINRGSIQKGFQFVNCFLHSTFQCGHNKLKKH